MAKKSSFQIYLEYIPVRTVFAVFGLLPRKFAVGFWMRFAAIVFTIFGGKWRRVGLRNLEIAFPEKSVDERREILDASIRNLGRIAGEMTQFSKATRETLAKIVDITRDDSKASYFFEQHERGRGTIITGAHFGNWEIGILGMSAIHIPIHFLARPLDNPLIEDYFVRLRARFGNRAIDKNNFVEASAAVLRDGGFLGVMPDVNMNPRFGVFVPFFSELACTTTGVAMLAMRTNAMIVPTCCVWLEDRKQYATFYGDFIEPQMASGRRDEIKRLTAAFTKATEDFIRQYPEQYFWLHRRWKTRPEGEAPLY
ncbi:MAG: lysophospholipid acyltransferase family protein [Acidobacteria bacterium]|nr:lysophospholipid acyltransferase family protein [Acidobacteriota bacterium]